MTHTCVDDGDIPTGLGKTAAATVAWLWKLYQGSSDHTRRLVYCLPMRVLVEQTHDAIKHWLDNATTCFGSKLVPSLHLMMGGDADKVWDTHPEAPAILVGTQDMLLSRALNRGYGVSRYRWPIQFGLLHNDTQWLFDETQLMGVAVETSAQLQGLRDKLGTQRPVRSLSMSATLSDRQLGTVDHAAPVDGWKTFALEGTDQEHPVVATRTQSRKQLRQAPLALDASTAKGDYVKLLADLVVAEHVPDTLTLIVLNRVARAQDLFAALLKRGRTKENLALIHSRFRPPDRSSNERMLQANGDRIIVATQAIEAGVDVSAHTMFTELAPWSSLVQRFGRCNRYGEVENAQVLWLDIAVESESLPYENDELVAGRGALRTLSDVGPQRLREVHVPLRDVVRPVLRRKDLLDLFDTTPDLSGNDLDVSAYIRDGDDTDVQIYWRAFDIRPDPGISAPDRNELCSVSIAAAKGFSQKQDLWRWDTLGGQWQKVDRFQMRPGQVLLAHADAGGYTDELGWLPRSKSTVPPLSPANEISIAAMDGDPDTCTGHWVTLEEHLADTAEQARAIAETLALTKQIADAVETAARWHDVGKAHDAFQNAICPDRGPELWAKSASPTSRLIYQTNDGTRRPGFRHELASALAWLQIQPTAPQRDLVAYLIAAHHGKVRLSIRSMPNEAVPVEERLFARGVWDGDTLPPLPGFLTNALPLRLDPMRLGEGSWLSRVLQLRDDPTLGPFRVAFLEAVVRIADWRASKLAQDRVPAHA